MTVQTSNYRNEYHGDCSTTTFAYTFRTLDKSHLDVYVAGTLKTLTTDYTVTGVDAANGGNVVMTTPPNLNELVVIERDVPFTQTTAYPEGGSFPASSHEKALDKLTMAIQAVVGLVRRSWRFPASSEYAGDGYEVPEPKAGYYVRIADDCTNVEFVGLENCGTYANPVTTKGDLIRGNDNGVQERLAMPASTAVLIADTGTGKPEWGSIGLPFLRNKTDAQADAGRLFSLSMDCDSAVVASGVSGCSQVGVVAPAAVGDDCLALFAFAGATITALAQGSIARGHYVKEGSTPGAFVTTCVSMMDHRPIPKGTKGLAISHSSGGCVSVITFGIPASGNQGLPAVRRNRSLSVSATPCTQVSLVADYLVLVDSCNDTVVVKNPATLTNNICTAFSSKNGRDNTELGGGFQAGDVHFYWSYEGASGTVYSRSSTKGPETSGPDLPSAETHWTYSHSLYWDSNCLRKHTVRGSSVFFDCTDSTVILSAGAATCETRVNFPHVVPAIATRVRILASYADTASSSVGDVAYLGYRLNCIAYTIGGQSTDGELLSTEIEIPNVNQEMYYRLTAAATLTLRVTGFDVPSGDS